ncbi:MAG TPA: hypothetical protein VLU43_11725 [Anaeromyxobacteraceae bacterium]|nr:hypothetical protein [Anaeromyxobacteraceae bacterium]
MSDPKALGAVLAMLVNAQGKPVTGGSGRGQLYVSADEVVVLRTPAREEWMHRIAMGLLVGSVVLVLANLFLWRTMLVFWIAVAAQAVYWITLPARRRALDPQPLSAAELEAARRAGRAMVYVPSRDVSSLVAREPSRPGFRRPARLELPEGALEIYLSEERFAELSDALRSR